MVDLVVTIFPIPAAARIIADELQPGDRLAVPGGSAAPVLKMLRTLPVWPSLRLTWTDERCVPKSDPQSNRGEAYRQKLLDEDETPAEEVALFYDAETPRKATQRVKEELDLHFEGKLDVVVLGMGEDGHIASLFDGPDHHDDLVIHVADSPKPPRDRITLTRRILMTARRTVLVVSGASKRAALERLLSDDPRHAAHGLPGLVVVTNQDLEDDGSDEDELDDSVDSLEVATSQESQGDDTLEIKHEDDSGHDS